MFKIITSQEKPETDLSFLKYFWEWQKADPGTTLRSSLAVRLFEYCSHKLIGQMRKDVLVDIYEFMRDEKDYSAHLLGTHANLSDMIISKLAAQQDINTLIKTLQFKTLAAYLSQEALVKIVAKDSKMRPLILAKLKAARAKVEDIRTKNRLETAQFKIESPLIRGYAKWVEYHKKSTTNSRLRFLAGAHLLQTFYIKKDLMEIELRIKVIDELDAFSKLLSEGELVEDSFSKYECLSARAEGQLIARGILK
ncbi:MAG: hypothetical protein WC838_07570 [Candidatus Margulisiibacteriota bacterium]|jgi:hypothetical protein